ncbi:hypothetical protein [Caulobacter sp. NIBR1757]|uniref:hypothetical protein n=1 Tax=Caulobacter sp. NIBR1757 TaxID=3016000 RepID=UPI0022F135EE|nr:hypothetical protein [Caulobacter sp. NIBR1757]WGM41056.1 hypothetical protein AMEJIAPC_04004 [Caulobacter sp. NIBR1757]
MTLSILARFHTQSDAQVAASALRSAGLGAVVFDEHYGGIDWVAQSALGGYRLMLPTGELADGRAILAIATEAPPDPESAPAITGSLPATVLTMAVGLLAGFEAGWLVTGIRRRQLPEPRVWLMGSLAALILFLVLGGGAVLIGLWTWKMLIDPP